MDTVQHNRIADFIWGIADDVLRDIYVRGKYRDVILPMTVVRRLDSVLEPTKDDVLAMKARLDEAGIPAQNQDAALRSAAKQAFYNTSPFTLRSLLGQPKQMRANFEAYLDGFSPNVQEILEKFEFRNQIPRLVAADALGYLIERFVDPGINLSPQSVLDFEGNVLKPGLDNHGMGTIFEELIRRFNEENNEEAGEHFTPRDVVKLMADLIFLPIADDIASGTYLVYDGACGTGGMLTVAAERLEELAEAHEKAVSIHLYGQEINSETYAITKADLLLKGEGDEADNMRFGSTLANDGFPSRRFDFMLSNPPYGKSWKKDLELLGGKEGMGDPRFAVQHRDEPLSLVTRRSDGQMEIDFYFPDYSDSYERVVEFEPDPDLRDSEQIPLLTEGGIQGFMEREVWPYAPGAWVDPRKTQIGYEISFTRHFYTPKPLRTLAEIRADIEALERETEGLLDEILVEVGN